MLKSFFKLVYTPKNNIKYIYDYSANYKTEYLMKFLNIITFMVIHRRPI